MRLLFYYMVICVALFYLSCTRNGKNNNDVHVHIKHHLKEKAADNVFQKLLSSQYSNIDTLKVLANELTTFSDKTTQVLGKYYLLKSQIFQGRTKETIENLENFYEKIVDSNLNFIKYEICFFINNYYFDEKQFEHNAKWIEGQYDFISKANAKIERTAIIYNLQQNINLGTDERMQQLQDVIPLLNKQQWGFYHAKIYKDLSYLYRSQKRKDKEIETLKFLESQNIKNNLQVFACDNKMQLGFVVGGDSGIAYLNDAISLAQKIGYTSAFRNLSTVKGYIYMDNKDYGNAYTCFTKSLKYDSISNDKTNLIKDLAYSSSAYYRMDTTNNYQLANQKYFNKGFNLLTPTDYYLKAHVLNEKIKYQSSALSNKEKVKLISDKKEADDLANRRDALINNFYISMRLRESESQTKLSQLYATKKSLEDKKNKQLTYLIFAILIISALSVIMFQSYKNAKKIKESNTVIEQQNNKLQQLVAQLEISNKNLENFAATAAHDIKSPLNTIRHGIGILKNKLNGKLDDEDIEIFDFITKSSVSFMNMINELLNFSKITQNLKPQTLLNLNELIDWVCKNLNEKIIEKKAKIIFNKKLPFIKAHQYLITQLFINILDNSLKYSNSKNCKIIIDNIKYDENFWKFSIQDFGIGIPENKTSEVFHLFKRINVSNDFEGSGIGLATCKKIIEFYKGKIWIESKENSYTTVNILLPIHLIIN